jgi:hypothetical protein
LGVGGKGPADQFNLAVHVRCDAVYGANEGSTSTAYHAVTDFSAHDSEGK